MSGVTNDIPDIAMKDAAEADASKVDDDGDEDGDDSDVELDGVDVVDEREVASDKEEGHCSTSGDPEGSTTGAPATATEEEDLDEDAAEQLAAEETALEEEALKEREELRKYEEKKKHGAPAPVDAKARLEYLMQQSDTFAHFLAGTS